MTLILPQFAVGSGAEIIIDGVTYKVPRADAGGRLYVNAYATGASEVKSKRHVTASDSSVRATVLTPTSGKKVRIVSCEVMNAGTTVAFFEVYFGTGANITSDATKAIMDARLVNTQEPHFALGWPDGGGPVGAVDDVVSLRTSADVGANGVCLIHYREE